MGFYTPGIVVDIKKTAKRNCAGAEYFGLNGDYPAGQELGLLELLFLAALFC